MAEGIFLHLLKKKGISHKWLVDSAGLVDWHKGKPPNERTKNVLKKNGITEYDHVARQVVEQDFKTFEYVFVMDHYNMEYVKQFVPKNNTAKISLLGIYDPQKQLIIHDPYCSHNPEVFDHLFEQCMRCCQAFLNSLN
ncbi:low molecular weight phosphotyrosine protein phosphatase-like [Physella acuta]|uniref:low molecular weight phosphotyrosine protein phosphatase-like n=1 Tax=Physella acuta TaxID=109671 RepID=UPI0027DE8000|nr:low molecular weight phosphotyrosine protein phosphatase-like [Physella acuta]